MRFDDPGLKRWVLWVGAVLLLILLMTVCFSGSEAKAAETETAVLTTDTFVVQASPVLAPARLAAVATTECWAWHFGPWENRDFWGNLRYGYGERVTACTNAARTKWVSLPRWAPYHYLGFWDHDWTHKEGGTLQYSHLYLDVQWRFTFKPVGVPLLHKEPSLNCDLRASNHTAYCERIY